MRGGGLYACGFAVTFVVLEASSIVDDVQDVSMIVDGQAIRFGLNFLIDSFINTGKSFVWPAYVVQFAAPWGAIGLGAAFVFFPKTLKKPIEKWLFGDDADSQEKTSAASSE